MRIRLLSFAVLGLTFALPAACAHEDVVEGPHGVERVPDIVRGQGRNTARDRAYAWWAQYDDNLTEMLERPRGKRWLTVKEAVLYAKRVWNLTILDETNVPAVSEARVGMAFGTVEREMARPLFVQALSMALESIPGCYVEQDERVDDLSFKRHSGGRVHIRMARPLQPDYHHPSDPDRVAEDEVAARVEAEAKPLGDTDPWTTWFELHDPEFQAEVSRLLAEFQRGEIADDAALREAYRALRGDLRHTRTQWLSTFGYAGLEPAMRDEFPESGGYDAAKDQRRREAGETGKPEPQGADK
ncbi:MAG: hypothetical protein M5U26_24315 [Planctomycetota bacterium]|nr:hypothetical protein [Planctomycetota bacterium]